MNHRSDCCFSLKPYGINYSNPYPFEYPPYLKTKLELNRYILTSMETFPSICDDEILLPFSTYILIDTIYRERNSFYLGHVLLLSLTFLLLPSLQFFSAN